MARRSTDIFRLGQCPSQLRQCQANADKPAGCQAASTRGPWATRAQVAALSNGPWATYTSDTNMERPEGDEYQLVHIKNNCHCPTGPKGTSIYRPAGYAYIWARRLRVSTWPLGHAEQVYATKRRRSNLPQASHERDHQPSSLVSPHDVPPRRSALLGCLCLVARIAPGLRSPPRG
jgi:hypothetical protein